MFALEDLDKIIAQRALDTAEVSYTRALLDKGVAHCAKKMGEEAVETIIAALGDEREAVVYEAADLLYHLLVLLRARHIPLTSVMLELERRTAQSGHEEKAAR